MCLSVTTKHVFAFFMLGASLALGLSFTIPQRLQEPGLVWKRILEQPRMGRGLKTAISIKLRESNHLHQRLLGRRFHGIMRWVKSPHICPLNKSSFC